MMTKNLLHIASKTLLAATLMLSAHIVHASAQDVQMAQDSCFAAGQDYASAQGATLVGAESATKDGKSVCKVVVLYEASNGNRPRREVVYLPN